MKKYFHFNCLSLSFEDEEDDKTEIVRTM